MSAKIIALGIASELLTGINRQLTTPEQPKQERRTLMYTPGHLHETLRECKVRLAQMGGLYQRAGRISRVVQQRIKSEIAGDVLETRIEEVPAGPLRALMSEAAIWQTESIGKDGAAKVRHVDPPDNIARALHQDTMTADDPLPDLSGLVNAPFLRRDGTVVQADRAYYDTSTGFYIDPRGVQFMSVDDAECTKADAAAALKTLNGVIEGYEMDDLSRAVALASFLTPFVRISLPMVPGFAIDAPVAGSGKTKLACLAGILATGAMPSTIPAGQGPDEQDKQFNASLLGGKPYIILDNVDDDKWSTSLLTSALTSPMIEVRPFGSSVIRSIPNTATMVLTGNNLAYPGDIGRRILTCRITPSVKDPTQTEFAFDPVDFTVQERTTLVHAALTILRAFALHGRRQGGKPMASYGRFADTVRDPLMWLGQPDIADALAKNTAAVDEPDDHLADVIAAWARHPVLSKGDHYVRDVLKAAMASADLQNAITAACDGVLSTEKLGFWLRAHKDQWTDDGWRVTSGNKGKQGFRWRIVSRPGAELPEAVSIPDGGFTVIEEGA